MISRKLVMGVGVLCALILAVVLLAVPGTPSSNLPSMPASR